MRTAKPHRSEVKPLALALSLACAALLAVPAAQAAVTVSNVSAVQTPGTKQVVITYDVASDATNAVSVSLAVSNGVSAVASPSVSGDVGASVPTGTGRSIVWNAGADWNGNVATLGYTVVVDDGAVGPPPVPENMVFVEGGTLPDIGNGALDVTSFYIGKYEVTKADWDAVYAWAITNSYSFGAGSGCAADHPVHTVNWYDVVKWCNARSEMEARTPVYTVGGNIYKAGQHNNVDVNASATGYRLPTEAEWEFAARGGMQSQGYEYSGGNDVNAVAWYRDNSGGAACNYWDGRGTWPVGQKTANELGIHDMSGNVWEWCFTASGSDRVVRGGSWVSIADSCRVGLRSGDWPGSAFRNIGFRAVLPPGQQ